jgi:hypothetical protein
MILQIHARARGTVGHQQDSEQREAFEQLQERRPENEERSADKR